uniref:Uncharacterized protein n=1 Tax=Oryza sativa subsp. japonica TaxID=39947 RepID=Q5Z7R4_ORYSJ|nr:hypothetical protein [Oryza sativa Japonica Group]
MDTASTEKMNRSNQGPRWQRVAVAEVAIAVAISATGGGDRHERGVKTVRKFPRFRLWFPVYTDRFSQY